MGLQERIDALQPRERLLLAVFFGLFVLIAVLLIPIGVSAMLADKRSENEQLREAIQRLFAERDTILAQKEQNEAVLARYKAPAPQLAGFLDKHAKLLGIDIPEFKDRPVVPHGKVYEERATDISMKKVPMRPLVLFMEEIAKASFPVSITKLTIRQRGAEADSWDVSMTVSAFHRVEPKKPATTRTASTRAEESL